MISSFCHIFDTVILGVDLRYRVQHVSYRGNQFFGLLYITMHISEKTEINFTTIIIITIIIKLDK